MALLLKPAIQLMQRLRFLPKFMLVTVVFAVPLLLVTTLLFNELDKSIAIARQERTGVDYIRQVQKLTRLTQQHRALRHIALGGNASAKGKATRK